MFDDFQLAGLSIESLTAQVLGLLGNPLVVGILLTVLALVFAPEVTKTAVKIAVGGSSGGIKFNKPYVPYVELSESTSDAPIPVSSPQYKGQHHSEYHRRMRGYADEQDADDDERAFNTAM